MASSATCGIEFSPAEPGTDFEFVDAVVGGAVPRNFIPSVEKGLRENLVKGVLAGFPMTGLRAKLYDGSYHPVDSSEMAFKTAARIAYKQCINANPVLLEPIMHVEISVPDEYMGDIMGDLNKRRGRILGMEQNDGQAAHHCRSAAGRNVQIRDGSALHDAGEGFVQDEL